MTSFQWWGKPNNRREHGMNGETMESIGAETSLSVIKREMNEARSGSFVCIRGYENKQGEVSDYWIQFGVNYGKLKERDVAQCRRWLDNSEPLSLTVKFGVYVDQQGNRHNRKAKDRTPMTETLVLDMADSRLRTAVEEVMEHLINPDPVRATYTAEAKGLYSNDSDDVLHVRDALLVHKVVRKEGEYPFSASSAEVAVRDGVRRKLGVGRYRQYVFDGRFDAVTIGGVSILVDGIDEKLYFADPAAVREAVREQVVA